MKFGALAGASMLALAVAGCSGGGGNPGECFGSAEVCDGVQPTPTPPGTDSAIGFYPGSTGTGRIAYSIVLATGDFWLLFGPIGAGNTLAGAEQGRYQAAQGRIDSGDLVDFATDGPQVTAGAMTGTYSTRASLAGTVTVPRETFVFTGIYDPNSETQATLAAAAGSYTGVAAMPGNQSAATATVTANGVVSGNTASACNFSGNLLTNANSKVYTLNLTFVGVSCPDNLTAGTGVAFVDGTRLYGAVFNSAKTAGFAFSGGR